MRRARRSAAAAVHRPRARGDAAPAAGEPHLPLEVERSDEDLPRAPVPPRLRAGRRCISSPTCRSTGEVRTFAVDRIQELSLLEERFTPIEELPDAAFPHSLGVHSGSAGARRGRIRAGGRRLRARPRVAPVATAARHRGGRRRAVARRLPRSRAPELDPQLWSLRPRHRARGTGARDRGTVRGSTSEVRVMTSRQVGLVGRVGQVGRTCLVLALLLAAPAFAATRAIKAGRVVDASGKVIDERGDRRRQRSHRFGWHRCAAGRRRGHRSEPLHADAGPDRPPHPHDLLLGPHARHAAAQPAAAAGWRDDGAWRRRTRGKTLETGVTTVRDLGASGDVDYAMRDLINMGKMIGPRMFVAGQGLSAPRADAPKPDYRQLAESRVAAGSDWVKVYGSRGSYQSVDTTQTLTFDEMKAAVDGAAREGPSGRDPLLRRLRREGRRPRRRRLDRARHRAGRRDDRRDGRGAAPSGCRPSITTATTSTRRTSSASRRRRFRRCRPTSRRTSSRRGARSRPA